MGGPEKGQGQSEQQGGLPRERQRRHLGDRAPISALAKLGDHAPSEREDRDGEQRAGNGGHDVGQGGTVPPWGPAT